MTVGVATGVTVISFVTGLLQISFTVIVNVSGVLMGPVFIVGVFTYSMMDFSGFKLYNWILEVLYLTFVITLALKK